MPQEDYYMRAKRYMQYTLLLEKITHNIGFFYALHKDMTRPFMGDLLYRVHNGKNYINAVWGKTGSGKSMCAQYINEQTTENASPDRMKFTDDEVLQELNKVPPKTTVIKDEQIDMTGEGSGQQEMALENIEATVRCLQVNLIYCSPRPKLHNTHYSLEIFWDWHETRKQTALWLYNDNDTQNPLGIVITGMPKADMTDYIKRKTEFATKVKNQEVGTGVVALRNAERFLTSQYCGALKSMKEIKAMITTNPDNIFDSNLTLGQVDTICSLITIKAREENIKLFMDDEKLKKIEDTLSKNPKTKNIIKGFKSIGKF